MRLFLATLLLAAPLTTQAQWWGMTAGHGASYFDSDARQCSLNYPASDAYAWCDAPRRRVTTLGITLRHQLARAVALQTELVHAQRGSADHHQDYFALPLMLRLGGPRGELALAPVGMIGVSPAVRRSCKFLRNGESFPCAEASSYSGYQTRAVDFGIIGGFGVEARMPGGWSAGVDVRLERGRNLRHTSQLGSWYNMPPARHLGVMLLLHVQPFRTSAPLARRPGPSNVGPPVRDTASP